jgi:hypothetical protein
MTVAEDRRDWPIMLEFVCPRCLLSRMGSDLAPIPRCPVCGTRMEPDDLSIPPARRRPEAA